MKRFCNLLCLFVVLCFTTALAQDAAATCSAFIEKAFADVQKVCTLTDRNQACYGYPALSATPHEGVENFTFTSPGDLANVADIDTLSLSALDSVENTWGIALIKLQANLPDTLPEQNVTFLLLGNVEIQNAVVSSDAAATIVLTAASNANIRSASSTSATVIGSLVQGDTITANGRNADGSWLRIQIPDSDMLGWVFANLVTAEGDVSALSEVDATESEVPLRPMQAFNFRTGITPTDCTEAPPDGILIQTPQGAGQINLRANDVEIQLGTTAFLQAVPDANMTISVLEGEGRVTVGNQTVVVPAGSQVNIPVDADGRPTGAIDDPQPYAESLVALLPVQILPEPITIVLLASDVQIATPTPTPTPSLPGSDFSGFTDERKVAFCNYLPFVGVTLTSSGIVPSPSEYLAQYFLGMVDDEQLLSALSQSEQVSLRLVELQQHPERGSASEMIEILAYADAVHQFCLDSRQISFP